jgi:hypothetical protein
VSRIPGAVLGPSRTDAGARLLLRAERWLVRVELEVERPDEELVFPVWLVGEVLAQSGVRLLAPEVPVLAGIRARAGLEARCEMCETRSSRPG